MKNLFKIKKIALSMIIVIFGVSCSTSNDTPIVQADTTIVGIATGNANLSILVAALTKTDLVTTLKSNGPFTVFAPTNAAFTAAGISVASINSSTPAQVADLKNILLNHVVNGSLQAAGLTTGFVKTNANYGTTTSKISMFINTTGGVKLNGNSNVITTTAGTTYNILASNGVIHTVDKVITLPTIVDLAVANNDFSSLTGALTTYGLVPTLQGAGPFTVFAPNNTAFTALTTELAGASITPTAAQFTSVLKYHVVSGANVLAANLPAVIAAGPTTTFNTQTITISLTPTPNIVGKFLPVRPSSKIIATDVQGSNGVIHVLDKVLLPVL
jgi:uncharacterized surface protein with fasciclin (FAS1) repeats